MTDHLDTLKNYSAWVGGDDGLQPSKGLFKAVDAAIEEIERLRVNERDSIATVRKWAAERSRMVAEIERLRKLATCGCGDGFTEHDPGTCGNCVAGMLAGKSAK